LTSRNYKETFFCPNTLPPGLQQDDYLKSITFTGAKRYRNFTGYRRAAQLQAKHYQDHGFAGYSYCTDFIAAGGKTRWAWLWAWWRDLRLDTNDLLLASPI